MATISKSKQFQPDLKNLKRYTNSLSASSIVKMIRTTKSILASKTELVLPNWVVSIPNVIVLNKMTAIRKF